MAASAWRKASVVGSGFLFNLTAGSIYTFANMNVYICSYLRKVGATAQIWGDSGIDSDLVRSKDLSLCYALAVVGIGLSVFIGGQLERRVGPRVGALVGGWLMSLGVALSALTIQHSYTMFLFTYGIMFGVASGLAYPCPLSCAFKWMPEQRGLAGGLILAGTGLSPLIFGPLQTIFVNPHNKPPTSVPYPDQPEEKYYEDSEIVDRVPLLLLHLAAIYATIQFIAAMNFVSPPETLPPPMPHRGPPRTVPEPAKSSPLVQISPVSMVQSLSFWTLWLLFFFNGQIVSFLTTFWKVVGYRHLGLSDQALAYIGNSVVAMSSAAGRILWGMASDAFTFKRCMIYITLLTGFFAFTLTTAAEYGPPAFFAWLAVLYSCIGGSFSMFPAVTAKTFGQTYFGTNYGVMYTARVASAVSQAIVLGQIYHKIGDEGVMPILAACSCISLMLTLLFDPHAAIEYHDKAFRQSAEAARRYLSDAAHCTSRDRERDRAR
ncbi:unnamed protein product [Vitrella brassicaformis CCMP3155]|uniref:Major facilitator superfamily (MFS) profile domain-containing protein n=2 Tax=Vitrella brassicaformis TaxID=1169539 RepID=A0A0G4GZC9_VITBC|nr:unnamed protein product [Vitrella brassicaformis CCMP3155]|mmetsp:Transcript_412/g.1222  ORF Transcript_412/g.1222 Transcript_412/m.1222 type:complete len:490 (+) Transcript_412:98-1567(+)|eukprot:CEM36611.1 unnamed protein product [Vitrella brassicaformis CCMP3155]